MAGFDAVYNEQCARIWNQPRSENPTYVIQPAGYYGDEFYVMEMHGGWGVGLGKYFKTKQDAEQFIKEYTSE